VEKRSVWLLLLFVAEAYTSSVIQHFEEALESAIALAFFIPLLIGTGGNSGTQITSTLVRAWRWGSAFTRRWRRAAKR
jgi:magnesium transporter